LATNAAGSLPRAVYGLRHVYVALHVQPLDTRFVVVEVKPMDTGLVKISADALNKDIDRVGHVAVYEVLQ